MFMMLQDDGCLIQQKKNMLHPAQRQDSGDTSQANSSRETDLTTYTYNS